ncbi:MULTISPECIES: hypothetical protein [unclassified Thalassotalea]|uniref:DUF4870 domain-containing protein n=1 Tax=unclassified Thalassotalea TaxID=2614972 RepID=UPI00108224D4|nr:MULTISPECIES: hypothetical protein [unclassified Thalassotalea]NMP17420.1 hypothetical protein [Thalassotalea sp. Y01]QBY02888.1 hypothetical protein E2K93_00215 [Thalassotalea sp. HSM 43]
MPHATSGNDMFKLEGRTIAIISYLTIVGWVIALIFHGQNPSRFSAFHLRQSLGMFLTWVILSFIPVIGWALAIPLWILWGFGLYYACSNQLTFIPLLGKLFDDSLNSLIRRRAV